MVTVNERDASPVDLAVVTRIAEREALRIGLNPTFCEVKDVVKWRRGKYIVIFEERRDHTVHRNHTMRR